MMAVHPWRRAGAPYDSRMIFSARVIAVLVVLGQGALAQPLDPARWGDDHVGKPLPNFTSGDECLFCHRDVGPGWPTNRHGQTIREHEPPNQAVYEFYRVTQRRDLAQAIELLLGRTNRVRLLKRSADQGRLDLLSVEWIPARTGEPGKLANPEDPHWDTKSFGARCAGCHASGVDSSKQTFMAISLDCFVCHGEVPDKHTTQGSLAVLSPRHKDSAAVVTSICGQCHLRGGVSKSSGLPYANNFVAGDNLFRDFRVDLSAAAMERLNPGDRHVQENVRDVVVNGREGVTCLSCHSVHQQLAKKHHTVADGASCRNCHSAESKKIRISYEVHSKTCEY